MVNVNLKVPFVVCSVFFLSIFNGLAHAADGAELYKTKTCNACHGVDAKTPLLPVYPKLAGQNPEYLVNQMRDIKSGARNNGMTSAMKAIMGMVDDNEMKAIADWLSGL